MVLVAAPEVHAKLASGELSSRTPVVERADGSSPLTSRRAGEPA